MKKTIHKINEIVKIFNQDGISIMNHGLFSGSSGIALFLYYYNHLENTISSGKNWSEYIELSIDLILKSPSHPSYCSGIAGTAFLISDLENKNMMDKNITEDIDSYLLFELRKEFRKNHYDFLHGALGISYYFIKRNNLVPILETLSFLENSAISEDSANKKKWTSYSHKDSTPEYNISLSHGISSIVCLLIKMYFIEALPKKRIADLITSSINYILDQEIDKDKYGSYFPYSSIESTKVIHRSRLAWCYGDLGVGITLFRAGTLLNQKDWINKSLEILLYAAVKRTNLKENLVLDANFCHGTSGIGHIFYRMWWNTQISEFKKAADYWFNQTLKMAHHTEGLAGYKTWVNQEPIGWYNTYGLLEGISGIGLALLSYTTNTEPSWDEYFLLS